MIAFAWLGRYALEELVLGFRRRQDRHKQSADLSFLGEPPGDTVEATLVEHPTTDSLNGEPRTMPLPCEEGLA